MTAFNHPFLLGFDELEEMLARMTKTAEGFPPYNIEQVDAEVLCITLAVAGYTESDLEMMLEDNQLVIRGHQVQDPNRRYLHHGIAARSFIKTFVLADGMTVEGACLENGLLSVNLRKPVRKIQAKRIAIKAKPKAVVFKAGRGQK